MNTPRWSWAGLVVIWATGVLFWTLAAARGLGESPLHALPFGIVQMGVAAVMAVGRLAPDGRRAVADAPRDRSPPPTSPASPSSPSATPPPRGSRSSETDRSSSVCSSVSISPYTGWNLLMGTWLYLAIAGVSYGRRAEAARSAGELRAGRG